MKMEQAIPGDDTLLWSALPELHLNIAQTAALCGISVRQLSYWTRQGYVTAGGSGARRLYGLKALRRILTIRQRMQEGASLRQAIRSLTTAPASPLHARPFSPGSADSEPDALKSEDAESLARILLDLFQTNRHLRDNAAGLAAKLGRAVDDVRQVAETLCARSALARAVIEGDAIYRPGGGKAP